MKLKRYILYLYKIKYELILKKIYSFSLYIRLSGIKKWFLATTYDNIIISLFEEVYVIYTTYESLYLYSVKIFKKHKIS